MTESNSFSQVVVVNKPRGKTSYDIVREFKKKYPGKKVGHAGTLDPLAEGVLIILIGKATKRQSEFMGLEKEYLVELVFGVVTPTWDLEFKPQPYETKNLDKKLEALTAGMVKKKLANFQGEIEQIVPAFSAVKVGGQRLYRLARKGRVDSRDLPRRRVEVKEIELLKFVSGKNPKAEIRMLVGKGTYVRSIVNQLGEDLGVGAVVSRLIRTKIGQFTV